MLSGIILTHFFCCRKFLFSRIRGFCKNRNTGSDIPRTTEVVRGFRRLPLTQLGSLHSLTAAFALLPPPRESTPPLYRFIGLLLFAVRLLFCRMRQSQMPCVCHASACACNGGVLPTPRCVCSQNGVLVRPYALRRVFLRR